MENHQNYTNWFEEEKKVFLSVIFDFLSNNASYRDILKNERNKHLEDISDALEMANKEHKNEERDSGEHYIIHPIAVVQILIRTFPDFVTVRQIIIALLHDVIESEIEAGGSGEIAKKQITERFGVVIAENVFHLSKKAKETYIRAEEIGNPPSKENLKERRDIDYFSKLYLLDDDELRVKASDFIHSIETIHHCREEKQRRIVMRGYFTFVGMLRKRFPDNNVADFLDKKLGEHTKKKITERTRESFQKNLLLKIQ